MIRTIVWNNGVTRSGFANPLFSRSDQTVDDSGASVGMDTPRHSLTKILCPAPHVEPRRTTAVSDRGVSVWGGRWIDGSDCLVELWGDSSTNTVKAGISFGVYGPDADHTKDLGSLPNILTNPSSDPGWRHNPLAIVIGDGCLLAICDALESNVSKAISICYWDENISAGGTKAWKLWYRGPNAQVAAPRGAAWIGSGPWITPTGVDPGGAIIEFFVVWVDYRNNDSGNNADGGQLFIMRCHRTDASSPWTLDEAVYLYQDTVTGGTIIPGVNSYMHFHSAAVTFGQESAESEWPMIVTLSVGDNFPNSRLVNIARDNYLTYTDDWPDTSPVADRPDVTVFPPQPATNADTHWTTYEDREGQRARIVFSGTYTTPPPRIDALPFAGYTQPSGGVTPLIITSGFTVAPQSVGIQSKNSSTEVNLNREPLGDQILLDPVVGYIWADYSWLVALVAPLRCHWWLAHQCPYQSSRAQ